LKKKKKITKTPSKTDVSLREVEKKEKNNENTFKNRCFITGSWKKRKKITKTPSKSDVSLREAEKKEKIVKSPSRQDVSFLEIEKNEKIVKSPSKQDVSFLEIEKKSKSSAKIDGSTKEEKITKSTSKEDLSKYVELQRHKTSDSLYSEKKGKNYSLYGSISRNNISRTGYDKLISKKDNQVSERVCKN